MLIHQILLCDKSSINFGISQEVEDEHSNIPMKKNELRVHANVTKNHNEEIRKVKGCDQPRSIIQGFGEATQQRILAPRYQNNFLGNCYFFHNYGHTVVNYRDRERSKHMRNITFQNDEFYACQTYGKYLT
jgi:hypothetical protein